MHYNLANSNALALKLDSTLIQSHRNTQYSYLLRRQSPVRYKDARRPNENLLSLTRRLLVSINDGCGQETVANSWQISKQLDRRSWKPLAGDLEEPHREKKRGEDQGTIEMSVRGKTL